MAPKTSTKKNSPSKAPKKSDVDSDTQSKKTVDQKRKSRHQYDRLIHPAFTPFFSGLEAHLVATLSDKKSSAEDIHKAILGYDAKAYFATTFETKGRRSNKKNKEKGKRPLSTFMLFQEEMRPRVTQKLEKDLGRKPSQPEVVRQLGKLWNAMKEKPGGTERYQKMYEENKLKLSQKAADPLADSDTDV